MTASADTSVSAARRGRGKPQRPGPTHISPLRLAAREAAWRFGWGPKYGAEVKAAQQISPPRRILERAAQAYEVGSIGLKPLARLLCMDPQGSKARLEEAGIRPPAAPEPRRINARSMTAARRGHPRRNE